MFTNTVPPLSVRTLHHRLDAFPLPKAEVALKGAALVAGLAFRAHRCYAHSPSFREKMRRPGTQGRDLLHVFMRHWLADRLRRERPTLFARLPREFAAGAALSV